ncbi:MAG: hypothetical protein EXS32_14745 [Opitutus sp.]|nr:hypothetical protein [Opitutus sp.]
MNASDPDHLLTRTLAEWHVSPPPNPRFRAAVWARLEAARSAPTWAGYIGAHAVPVAGALAIAVMVGGLIGRGQARARVAAERATMVNSYVQALDARTMRMP